MFAVKANTRYLVELRNRKLRWQVSGLLLNKHDMMHSINATVSFAWVFNN